MADDPYMLIVVVQAQTKSRQSHNKYHQRISHHNGKLMDNILGSLFCFFAVAFIAFPCHLIPNCDEKECRILLVEDDTQHSLLAGFESISRNLFCAQIPSWVREMGFDVESFVDS